MQRLAQAFGDVRRIVTINPGDDGVDAATHADSGHFLDRDGKRMPW